MQQKALLFCKAKRGIVGDEFCENLCKKDAKDGGFACDAELNRECTNGGVDPHGFCSCYLPREEIPNFVPDDNPIARYGTPCLFDKCQTEGYRNRNHQDMLENTCPNCIQNNSIQNSTVIDSTQSNTCLNQKTTALDGNPIIAPKPTKDSGWKRLKSWYKDQSTGKRVGVVVVGVVLVVAVISLILYLILSENDEPDDASSDAANVVSDDESA
jgi:hypothetical protein